MRLDRSDQGRAPVGSGVMLRLMRRIARLGRATEPGPPPVSLPVPVTAAAPLRGSLQIRQVDAGSCNACEAEFAAAFGPVYDAERFGVRVVASPRHADALVVTGPVTRNMESPLRRTLRGDACATGRDRARRLRSQLRCVRRGVRRGRSGQRRDPRRSRDPRVPAVTDRHRGGAALGGRALMLDALMLDRRDRSRRWRCWERSSGPGRRGGG